MVGLPKEVKDALACLKSIDKSLGRIANVLESQHMDDILNNVNKTQVRGGYYGGEETEKDKGIPE